ncbi:hypothetical protein [Candidatus Poriferisodalis sp.]|uniref:hypothetical protein n=1 Tax=Candidatus Poriferisodalis sp. TaxID=3101277 RepID=UPI003B029FBC
MLSEPLDEWVRPWWAERQLDPASAAYAPAPSEVQYWRGEHQVSDTILANTLGRSWTTVGRPETLDRAAVDPRGLTVWRRWSLDWWLRVGEEWIYPSREPTVRQRLVEGMPVVETVVRVGGGDVTHRVAAARGTAVQLDDAVRHVRQRPVQQSGPKWWGRRHSLAPSAPRRTARQPNRVAPDARANAVPEVFIIEIANRTAAPMAVALAARPFNFGAWQHVHGDFWEWSAVWGIDQISAAGQVMTLDDGFRHALGRVTVIFDRAPGDIVMANAGADCAAMLAAADSAAMTHPHAARTCSGPTGAAAGDLSVDPLQASPSAPAAVSVECSQHLANAAAVFPLVSGATLRVAVVERGTAFDWDDSASPALGGAVLAAVPGLDRVASGWRKRVNAGCRLELPSGRLAAAALSARAAQLLSTAPFDDGAGVAGPMLASALDVDLMQPGDDLVQLSALVESGMADQVRDLLLRQAQAQSPRGETTAMGVSVTGTSLVLVEHLLTLQPDPAFAHALGEFVASAARWLVERSAAEREEPWTIREGLRAGYRLLLRLGADRAAHALGRAAMSLPELLRTDVGAAPGSSTAYRDRWGQLPWERPPQPWISGPTQPWDWERHDTGLWICAAVPWAPPLPFVRSEPAVGTPDDFVPDIEVSRGNDMVATALLAFAEVRPAPARAFGRLEAMVSVASPTLNWPTFLHPSLRTGTNGTGHDLTVGGLFVRTLLRLLVDVPDRGVADSDSTNNPAELRLAAHWPAAWLGQPVEVHDVPTRIGSVSWAVRWHGERPALLWEVVPHRRDDPDGDDSGAVALAVTAPGLDRSFTATGWQGETLLAPLPA